MNIEHMIKADKYYKANIDLILTEGSQDEKPRPKYKDGTPAYSRFLTQVWEEYDISKNEFPITTLRNTAIKSGISEILWIYQDQSSSLKDAESRGVSWWKEWDIGDGTIGQRYGATVRRYNLMNKRLYEMEKNPFSRRHIMTLYQEADLAETDGLFPCAYETIWSVRKVNEELVLDMTLIQRSNDYLVAGYINKIQYVALQMMVASHLGYQVGKFCHLVQNLHIYDRHFDAAVELMAREPLEDQPMIALKEQKKFYDFTVDDFEIKYTKGITKIESPLELAI